MIKELIERDLDLLQGWRKARKDALVLRKEIPRASPTS